MNDRRYVMKVFRTDAEYMASTFVCDGADEMNTILNCALRSGLNVELLADEQE